MPLRTHPAAHIHRHPSVAVHRVSGASVRGPMRGTPCRVGGGGIGSVAEGSVPGQVLLIGCAVDVRVWFGTEGLVDGDGDVGGIRDVLDIGCDHRWNPPALWRHRNAAELIKI